MMKEPLKNTELYKYVKCSKCGNTWNISASTPLDKILEMACKMCNSNDFNFYTPIKK